MPLLHDIAHLGHAELLTPEPEAGEQLRGLGVPPRVASASEQWLRQLAEEQGAAGAQRSSASSSP